MLMIWIDANIFLEIELKQKNFKSCFELLQEVKAGKVAVTSDFLIYSVILSMQRYKCSAQQIKIFIASIASLKNLIIYRPSLSDMNNALSVMEKNNLDFDDSLVYSCMKSLGVNKLASLDNDFKRFKDIEIIFLY